MDAASKSLHVQKGTTKPSKAGVEFRSRRFLSLHLILEGCLIGIVSGIVIALFRTGVSIAQDYFEPLISLNALTGHSFSLHGLLIIALILIIVACSASIITKLEVLIGGSGIPQVSAQLAGRLQPCWYTVLPAKIIGGLLCLGSGLTLGREGPSVQIGASIGDGFGCLLKRPSTERRYLLTAGAAAGLAAAFNAPLAGVVFSLEELHKNFSPTTLVTSMTASFTAVFVEGTLLGVGPVLAFYHIAPLPMHIIPWLVLLGIALAFGALIFNKAILYGKHIYAQLPFPAFLKYTLPFIISIIIFLWAPSLFGSGESLVYLAGSEQNPSTLILMAYVIAKFILLLICFCSGLPGGIFFPMLVLGSLLGNIFGQFGSALGLWDTQYVLAFSLLAMCGNFSAIVRSPMTGILLISEMTSSFSFMLPLGIVALVSFFTSELIGNKPIYESLQELLVGIDNDPDDKHTLSSRERILIEYAVEHNSKADGHRISSLHLPEHFLIIAIKRGTSEIFPGGSVRLHGGDYIVCYLPKESVAYCDTIMEDLLKEQDTPDAHIFIQK